MSSSKPSELSIEALLNRVREGEQGAWEALLRRSESNLEDWAARRIGNAAPGGIRASDVTQEAALGAFQRFASFRGTSEGEWRVWLEQVLHSRWVDLLRKAGSQKRNDVGALPLDASEAQDIPAPQRSPSTVSFHQEEWRRLLACFYELPDAQREALSLYYLHDSTVMGIAQRLGRSREAVDSLLQRGLRTLRARMEGVAELESEENPDAILIRNQVDAALSVYFRRREEGKPLEPDTFAAGYPECADELRGLLHWLEKLRALQPSTDS
ncbi:sigma-70 family RNA polymerase sigma factor [Archangium violaceum]|uniref:RNA polymerase sigma factor n=1 Tax=Archangium violaceum TaxID=83451 RepID=UPI0019526662|nr:sigma-70 family RNA polymerase sigma factor [Archangium violaceum]QRN96603.1 sigma-70 family RNA polymerase sigma factor [Archangium violaceum]